MFLVKPGFPLKHLLPADLAGVGDTAEETRLSVRLYRAGPWSVFELGGEIDVQVVPVIRALPGGHTPHVIFDLRDVTFMDCGGLRAIVSASRTSHSEGGCVRVVASSRQVRRLLTLTRVDRVVSLFESLEEALDAPVLPPEAIA